MRGWAIILVLCVVVFSAVSANAYEFKLLNGMKIKGALKSFADGRFVVETDIGQVAIEADKLDYIVVEASDPGPCETSKEPETPGLGLCHGAPPSVKGAGKAEGSEDEATAPQPLAGHSVPPAPLRDRSVRPAPLGTFSVDATKAYPGLFNRGRK